MDTLLLYIVLLLLLVSVSPLLLGINKLWLNRKTVIYILASANMFLAAWVGVLAITTRQLYIGVGAFVTLYQLFNLYRADRSKIASEHLKRITIKSTYRLWVTQVLILAAAYSLYYFDPTFNTSMSLAIFSYLMALMVFSSTWKNYSKTYIPTEKLKNVKSLNLPTLTVAIPARNESESLNNCLISLLASNYPKLEIMVLDDHSTDRRTPEIIRSFAHDGVEFIQGKSFNSEWLAKNWAYEQLLDRANGDLVLFCGADTRFEPDTLRELVSILLDKKLLMLSILPFNEYPNKLRNRFFQPLRYAWEVSLPRQILHRPSVLPTSWLVEKDFLLQKGSFKGVSRKVSPESYFAKLAMETNRYSFFQFVDIKSQKPSDEQKETAFRLRYPQLHRQVESVMLATLAELLGGISVIFLIIFGIFTDRYVISLIDLLAYVFYTLAFLILSKLTYSRKNWLMAILWPLFLGLDILVMTISMHKYELDEVLWKGRSIAPSVMEHAASNA